MDVFEKAGLCGKQHPRSLAKEVQYGTAGFRLRAEELDHIAFRMGLLSALFSKYRAGAAGLMITASHNPEEDNGIKIIDVKGEMMPISWEKTATKLANVSDSMLGEYLETIVTSENINIANPANVFIAMDTRPSSESLAQAAMDGVKALDGNVTNFGLLTTPQLHFIVCAHNTQGQYGQPSEEGYYNKIGGAFLKLNQKSSYTKYVPQVNLDLANGVSAPKIELMKKHIGEKLTIATFNDGSSGKLNYGCGADYVKVQQGAPAGIEMEPGMKCLAYDGDGDRIVYFCKSLEGKFCLFDGDKIAVLISMYLNDLLKASQLSLKLGVVQTAYANGASTKYMTEEMKVPVACVLTGVKHLHHKAQEFDIGVYFEANGHGTVLFHEKAMDAIRLQASSEGLDDKTKNAAKRLSALLDLINQTVGDAISDMLVVETILAARDWSLAEWYSLYQDLPNRLCKVKVRDRSVVQTTDAERQATQPPGLQKAIDDLVAKYKSGRSFVRPSGTEDVVRVYAEADTQVNADQLAYEVSMEVYNLARGTGDRPCPPTQSS